MSGKLKQVFPGGNTCQGFYSFYDSIIEPDATRILVIKGGPGVGKSTFMRWIGERMLEKGFDVEYHHCSSDNGSLDGVVIPAIKVALIDGTAPHIVDPKNPGAVDEIIHLGDFWDEAGLRASKDGVIKTNLRVGRFFRTAYSCLKEAKVIRDEWESYVAEAVDKAAVAKLGYELVEDIFQGTKPQFAKAAKERHLFGSAITPKGPETFLPTLLQDVSRIIVFRGEPGSGKFEIIAKVLAEATGRGFDSEVYHCPLDPSKIDFLVVPALDVALINGDEPLKLDLSQLGKALVIFNFNEFLNIDVLDVYENEIEGCKVRFWTAYDRAIAYVAKAKQVHDDMETYYIPNMNFAAINAKRNETLDRILAWAKEFGY